MPSETFTLMLYCSPHCAVNCTAVSHYIQWCNPAIIVKTHCLLLGLHDTPPLFSSVYPPRKSPMMHSPSFACVSLRPLCFLAFPCLMHVINQLVSGVLIIVQPRKISTKKKKGGRNSVESELWLSIMSFEIESSLSCVIFGDLACVLSSLPNPDV